MRLPSQLWFEMFVFMQSVSYFAMISFLDYAPNWIRRRMLSGEYKGEALEARLKLKISGGWRMFKALHHMGRIQMRPALSKGLEVPADVTVTRLDHDEGQEDVVDLGAWSRSLTRPLVLNFGSCT